MLCITVFLQPLICHIIFNQLLSFKAFFFFLFFLPATGCSFAVNSARSSRFIINLLFPGALTPGMWSQMFQLPPKMAQSRSPDSADAPDSKAVAACMIYCFKGRPHSPAWRLWRRERLWFILLNKRSFSSQEVAAGELDAVKERPSFSGGGDVPPPPLHFALRLPIFPHRFFFSSALSAFVSSGMCHYCPYVSRLAPRWSAFIPVPRLVSPPPPSPLVLSPFIFFPAVLLLSFHIYSLRQPL